MNQLDVAVAGCDALSTLALFLVDVQFFPPASGRKTRVHFKKKKEEKRRKKKNCFMRLGVRDNLSDHPPTPWQDKGGSRVAIIRTQCRTRCCFCAVPPLHRNCSALCLPCGQTGGGFDCAVCLTATLIRSSQKAALQLLHSITNTRVQISNAPPPPFLPFCKFKRHWRHDGTCWLWDLIRVIVLVGFYLAVQIAFVIAYL